MIAFVLPFAFACYRCCCPVLFCQCYSMIYRVRVIDVFEITLDYQDDPILYLQDECMVYISTLT